MQTSQSLWCLHQDYHTHSMHARLTYRYTELVNTQRNSDILMSKEMCDNAATIKRHCRGNTYF